MKLPINFLGLDVSNVKSDLRFRGGFKCNNWITVLSNDLVNDKLSGFEQLKQCNLDQRNTFYPDTGGVVVPKVTCLNSAMSKPTPIPNIM